MSALSSTAFASVDDIASCVQSEEQSDIAKLTATGQADCLDTYQRAIGNLGGETIYPPAQSVSLPDVAYNSCVADAQASARSYAENSAQVAEYTKKCKEAIEPTATVIKQEAQDRSGACVPAPGVTCPPAKQTSAITPPKHATNSGPSANATGSDTSTDTPTDSSPAAISQSQINQDLATCSQAVTNASQCCANPSQCTSNLSAGDQSTLSNLQSLQNNPPSGNDMAASCNYFKQIQSANSQAQQVYSTICSGQTAGCSVACSDVASRYQSMLSSASSSDRNLLQSAIGTLNSKSQQCNSLQADTRSLASASTQSGKNSVGGAACEQASGNGTGTSSLGDLASLFANSGDSADAASVNPDCSTNPNGLGCTPPQQQQTGPSSAAAFQEAKPKQGNYDASPNPPTYGNANQFGSVDPSAPGAANVIANNSGPGVGTGGGAMPANNGAQLGPAANRGGGGGFGAKLAEIFLGERSGGGFDYNQLGGGAAGGAGAGAYNAPGSRGSGMARGLASVNGLDLKKYLPGGTLDPRRVGGVNAGVRNPEFLSRYEDMWSHISARYNVKCRNGVLMDCAGDARNPR